MSAKKTVSAAGMSKGLESYRGSWILDADREDLVSILENAPCGIVVNKTNADGGDVLYINNESFNLLGYTVSEVPTGKDAQKKFSQDPREVQKMLEFHEELERTGKAVGIGRAICKDGRMKHIEIRGVLLRDKCVVTIWTDVTRGEIAKADLRESEAKFRTLFEQSSDAVLLFYDGLILDCNRAAEKLFHAQDKKQLVNSSLARLSPGRQPDGRLSSKSATVLFARAIEKKSFRFEWQLKRFDGSVFPVEASATTIQLQRQKVLYVILRDITAWKKAEKALLEARNKLEERVKERTSELSNVNVQLRREIQRREKVETELQRSREELRLLSEHLQRAREEEGERIAREVHDELGQFLSALKIDVACLGKPTMVDHDEMLNQTHNIEKRIDNAIHSVRHICSELRPPILDDFGLSAAIEWYLGDFQKRTGIRCKADIDPNIPKGKKGFRLMLFRVFQEAMTNILRHSAATEVNVRLEVVSGMLKLKVQDNGRGIAKREMEDPRSFGINGIRERVRFWGGNSHFKGSPSNGTTMTVSIPIKEKNERGRYRTVAEADVNETGNVKQ